MRWRRRISRSSPGSTADLSARLVGHELVFAKLQGNPSIAIDDACSLDYAPADIVWFDEASGRSLQPKAA